jgi:Uma2 family endonuclease
MVIHSIEDLDFDKSYFYADYQQWFFQERVELIKGRVFQMGPSPGTTHQRILGRLINKIYSHLAGKNGPCEVFASPYDVRLTKKQNNKDVEITTVVQPDVCVVCDPSKIDKKGCLGAPNWIIEVLSPGNTHKEMREKFSVYEENEVKEYWLLHPADQTLQIYLLDERSKKYQGLQPMVAGQIARSYTLPELEIDLAQIFYNP